MSQYQLTGKVFQIDDTQTFASGFSKREFVVETDGKYPQEIKLEAHKERADKLDRFQIGDPVTVSFDIRGNEYQGRHYVNLVAWKIEGDENAPKSREDRPGDAARASGGNDAQAAPPASQGASEAQEEEDDDIPF